VKLLDMVNRIPVPEPWSEGDNIPWHEPGFSMRMLREHFSQAHDAASRRTEKIEQHVRWLHSQLLSARSSKILDLGCGPGLYTSRLATLGHQCVGIDYSPASIAYAAAQAKSEGLRCTYLCQDMRTADYGTGLGLVMQIFGEMNVFRRGDAELILKKAHSALAPGGLLLLEVHAYSTVQTMGEQSPSWYTSSSGLFIDEPHICLQESSWDPGRGTATVRFYVIQASTGNVTPYAQSLQAYSKSQYLALVAAARFQQLEFLPSLTGSGQDAEAGFLILLARKPQDTA
jgi:SAM-dependent methyltransferase